MKEREECHVPSHLPGGGAGGSDERESRRKRPKCPDVDSHPPEKLQVREVPACCTQLPSYVPAGGDGAAWASVLLL